MNLTSQVKRIALPYYDKCSPRERLRIEAHIFYLIAKNPPGLLEGIRAAMQKAEGPPPEKFEAAIGLLRERLATHVVNLPKVQSIAVAYDLVICKDSMRRIGNLFCREIENPGERPHTALQFQNLTDEFFFRARKQRDSNLKPKSAIPKEMLPEILSVYNPVTA